jgi:hypothetical protein
MFSNHNTAHEVGTLSRRRSSQKGALGTKPEPEPELGPTSPSEHELNIDDELEAAIFE